MKVDGAGSKTKQHKRTNNIERYTLEADSSQYPSELERWPVNNVRQLSELPGKRESRRFVERVRVSTEVGGIYF